MILRHQIKSVGLVQFIFCHAYDLTFACIFFFLVGDCCYCVRIKKHILTRAETKLSHILIRVIENEVSVSLQLYVHSVLIVERHASINSYFFVPKLYGFLQSIIYLFHYRLFLTSYHTNVASKRTFLDVPSVSFLQEPNILVCWQNKIFSWQHNIQARPPLM